MPAKLLRKYFPNTNWKLIHFLEANIKIVKLWDKNSVFWIRLVVIHLSEKSLYVNFVILLFVIVFFCQECDNVEQALSRFIAPEMLDIENAYKCER